MRTWRGIPPFTSIAVDICTGGRELRAAPQKCNEVDEVATVVDWTCSTVSRVSFFVCSITPMMPRTGSFQHKMISQRDPKGIM